MYKGVHVQDAPVRKDDTLPSKLVLECTQISTKLSCQLFFWDVPYDVIRKP